MPISDPQSVSFCNNVLRPAADEMGKAYYRAKAMLQQWNNLSLSTNLTNTSDQIMDGSQTDGRSIITGADVNAAISAAQSIVSSLEANNNQILNTLLKPAVNPLP